MAGGAEAALDRVRPVLDTFSARVFHMGASGAGHTAKLLNNFLNGISLAATAEVMVAARKAGLELHTFLDVLNNSSGVNFATLNRFPRIVDGDYLEGGLTGNLMLKDLRLYAELARELDVRTPTAERMHRGVRTRRGAGLRRADLQPGGRRDRRRLRWRAPPGTFQLRGSRT